MTRSSRSILFAACTALLLASPRASAAAGMQTFRGGETASLHGLEATAATTDLALVNLADVQARCSLALAGAAGERLAPTVVLTLAPRESRPYLDALEGLAAPYLSPEVVATVSCDRAFAAFAVGADANAGRFEVVPPKAATATEELAALAALTAPVAACAAGAVCFDAPGLVHVPKPPGVWQDAVGRVAFPVPAGTASRLRLSIDVKVGDWFAAEPNGKHLVYWFVVDKNIDMPGLLYFRGPSKNEAFGRHGVQLKHAQKIKMIRPFAAQPGHTYRVVNDYDMGARTITITVTDLATGEVAVTLRGRTNVETHALRAGQRFLVDMGFYPGKVPTEVPSYGWEYRDVHIEAFVGR